MAKQLECHGFVCDSPEEAIMVAANLYQALLETMQRNKRAASQSQVRLVDLHSELCVIKCMEIEIRPLSSRENHPGESLSPYIL